MSRAVDGAMDAERPEKQTVRELWFEKAQEHYGDAGDDEVLYLTLGGAEARDVRLLINRGLIGLTEVGAVATNSLGKVVAVESNARAVLSLQSKFPGLKIVTGTVAEILRGDKLVRFPDGTHEEICRARVVNLDLDCCLDARDDAGEIVFPVLTWVKKLGQIHAQSPRKRWTLLLTLHAEIHWTVPISGFVQGILRDNFTSDTSFCEVSREFLGRQFFNELLGEPPCRFGQRERVQQQRVLMLFVPKRIVQSLHDQSWKIETKYNIRYGKPGHAPMVTWIIDFLVDETLRSAPNSLYKENIGSITSGLHSIDETGAIVRDSN